MRKLKMGSVRSEMAGSEDGVPRDLLFVGTGQYNGTFEEPAVGGDQKAALARVYALVGLGAERSRNAERTKLSSSETDTERRHGVLEQWNSVSVGNTHQAFHVAGKPTHVHGNNCLHIRRELRYQICGIHVQVLVDFHH